MDREAAGSRVALSVGDDGPPRMTLLMASDGSPGALRAAEWIARHFAPAQVVLTIVVVREQYSPKFNSLYPMYTPTEDDVNTEQWALDTVTETAARLGEFRPTPKIRVGDPVREILAEVRETVPDLLVVGHRGLRGLEGMVMGSVAKSLVQHSPVPVLVIPSGHAAPARSRSSSAVSENGRGA